MSDEKFDQVVAIGNFVRRQTPVSQYSHWTISDDELVQRITDNLPEGKQGYRDGVMLVEVNPDGFFSSVKVLQEGDQIHGEFVARQAGEQPRKSTFVYGEKTPAKLVEIVLYRWDVLNEGNERTTNAEWEIVAVNAAPTNEPQPIGPNVLLANHFELSGGTKTNMTDEQLVRQLGESVRYWQDKVLVRPKP